MSNSQRDILKSYRGLTFSVGQLWGHKEKTFELDLNTSRRNDLDEKAWTKQRKANKTHKFMIFSDFLLYCQISANTKAKAQDACKEKTFKKKIAFAYFEIKSG